MVRTQAVFAVAYEYIVWYAEGDALDIEIRRAPGFDPFASALGFTDAFTFVAVGPSTGSFSREGGGTGYLTWEIRSGIVATILGDGSIDEMVSVAERLTPGD